LLCLGGACLGAGGADGLGGVGMGVARRAGGVYALGGVGMGVARRAGGVEALGVGDVLELLNFADGA